MTTHDDEGERLLDSFVKLYDTGAQGCEMDYETAQALALAIKGVIADLASCERALQRRTDERNNFAALICEAARISSGLSMSDEAPLTDAEQRMIDAAWEKHKVAGLEAQLAAANALLRECSQRFDADDARHTKAANNYRNFREIGMAIWHEEQATFARTLFAKISTYLKDAR